MRPLGKSTFGATTFCASTFSNDQCGANGLPLTPNSIKILGRFQYLKTLDHPHVCRYIHLARCKHERVIVVSEYLTENLAKELQKPTSRFKSSPNTLPTLAHQVISALDYLHNKGIIVRNLCPEHILLDAEGDVKLSNYHMYHITGFGEAVPFPIEVPLYSSPAVLTFWLGLDKDVFDDLRQEEEGREVDPDEDPMDIVKKKVSAGGGKCDIWSLGVILLQAALDIKLWPDLKPDEIIHKITSLAVSDEHPMDIIAKENDGVEKLKELSPELSKLIRSCLNVESAKRPTAQQLLRLPLFDSFPRKKNNTQWSASDMFSVQLRCQSLEIEPYDDQADNEIDDDHLAGRSIEEAYYFWRLAGGDLEATVKTAELIKSNPPIMSIPSFTDHNGEQFGQSKDRSILLDDTVVILPQDKLRQRLKSINPASYYLLLEDESSKQSTSEVSEISKQPLIIRETHVEYQFHRILLFERLLRAYPYKRQHLWKEARVDIPPLLRAHVWAALLEIEGDVYGRYNNIDKMTCTATDRQIEVDVPRCHQYNDLFSSPEGHLKFKRILKAWVVSHPEYVYWQGLDSLCAPFLHLNFNNEAVAFACLDAFIPKYLHKFFLKDNSAVIQEYLAVFSHLITFHDPELSNHLNGIGFIPDLYSIPWFLTMYAHVFPLHKIFHLWDTLLLGSSSFPLFIGVAILQQLRAQLLSFGFNECILLFSDMPDIDIERCVQDSIRLFCSTPKSATFRLHARPPSTRLSGSTMSGMLTASTMSANSSTISATPSMLSGGSSVSSAPSTSSVPSPGSSYNYMFNSSSTDMFKDPLPLSDLKQESCSRICADDVVELCDLVTPAKLSPPKRQRGNKPKVIVIDVRSKEEYLRGTVPGAINIPFLTAFTSEGRLVSSPATDALYKGRALVKVVMSNRMQHATKFAQNLVKQSFSRVCVLHNGLDSIRSSGVLTVPTPEL